MGDLVAVDPDTGEARIIVAADALGTGSLISLRGTVREPAGIRRAASPEDVIDGRDRDDVSDAASKAAVERDERVGLELR
jgi:hypothetical protein